MKYLFHKECVGLCCMLVLLMTMSATAFTSPQPPQRLADLRPRSSHKHYM